MVHEIDDPISTIMTRSKQRTLGHFESTNDRGLRDNGAIIPEDAKSELLPAAVFDESILILIPWQSQGKRILQPRPLADDGLNKQLYATEIS